MQTQARKIQAKSVETSTPKVAHIRIVLVNINAASAIPRTMGLPIVQNQNNSSYLLQISTLYNLYRIMLFLSLYSFYLDFNVVQHYLAPIHKPDSLLLTLPKHHSFIHHLRLSSLHGAYFYNTTQGPFTYG